MDGEDGCGGGGRGWDRVFESLFAVEVVKGVLI
jgi:hypothetical protein